MSSIARIVDCHHHLWGLGLFPYAWLADNAPPRPFGDHSAIKRDYLARDYLSDTEDINLRASVFIQANSGAKDPAAEAHFAAREAKAAGLDMAIVGFVDLNRGDTDRQLVRQSAIEGFRGVRIFAGYDEDAIWKQTNDPHYLKNEAVTGLCESLSKNGLSLDLVVYPRQLADVAWLSARFPELAVAINHLAMLRPDLSDEVPIWRDGIGAIAEHGNIALKISGLWTIDRQWRLEAIGPHVGYAIETLGANRLMYGSNMPVEGVMIPVASQVANLSAVLAGRQPDEIAAIYANTAAAFYRLS